MGNLGWALLAGLLGGTVISSLMGGRPQAPPQPTLLAPPTQPAQTPQTQPAQSPDYQTRMKQNRQQQISGPSRGVASTFLTGPRGVAEEDLVLGRSSLLGA